MDVFIYMTTMYYVRRLLLPLFAVALCVSPALAQVSTGAAVSGQAVASSPCIIFTHPLSYGWTDSSAAGEVSALQSFLYGRGYLSVNATGYFGRLTAAAVARFQLDNGIPGIGTVGPLTRAKLREISCGDTNPSPTPHGNVTIYSILPTSGPTGTQVTVDGYGFSSDNTIHFGSGVILHVPITSSIAIACTTNPSCRGGIHQTLVFTVPSSLNPACYYSNPRCLIASMTTQPGPYQVYVDNGSGGISNAMTFTVTRETSQQTPTIYAIVPASGPVGTQVTIEGSGFTATNNIIHFGGGAISGVPAQSAVFNCPNMPAGATPGCGAYAQTLTFSVPSSIGPYCPSGSMCPMYMQLVTPGSYQLYVQNDNGSSNTTSFAVTGTAPAY